MVNVVEAFKEKKLSCTDKYLQERLSEGVVWSCNIAYEMYGEINEKTLSYVDFLMSQLWQRHFPDFNEDVSSIDNILGRFYFTGEKNMSDFLYLVGKENRRKFIYQKKDSPDVKLNTTESNIIAVLSISTSLNSSRGLNPSELATYLYGGENDLDFNPNSYETIIWTNISRIRKKIGDENKEIIRSLNGYNFNPDYQDRFKLIC